MSTEDTGIRRSVDANHQQESRANGSPEQQLTCRTADAGRIGPMKVQNKNKLAEQLLPINSRKARPMNHQNNNNITEQ